MPQRSVTRFVLTLNDQNARQIKWTETLIPKINLLTIMYIIYIYFNNAKNYRFLLVTYKGNITLIYNVN